MKLRQCPIKTATNMSNILSKFCFLICIVSNIVYTLYIRAIKQTLLKGRTMATIKEYFENKLFNNISATKILFLMVLVLIAYA